MGHLARLVEGIHVDQLRELEASLRRFVQRNLIAAAKTKRGEDVFDSPQSEAVEAEDEEEDEEAVLEPVNFTPDEALVDGDDNLVNDDNDDNVDNDATDGMDTASESTFGVERKSCSPVSCKCFFDKCCRCDC